MLDQLQQPQRTNQFQDEVLPSESYLAIEQSPALSGSAQIVGAKNAVLVIMTSLLLADGTSELSNVPDSEDVHQMMKLLEELGAQISFYPDKNLLLVNTSTVNKYRISAEIMKKMRASVLVLGPLLARLGRAEIAMPGGDQIGTRPIDIHLKNLVRMGAHVQVDGEMLYANATNLEAKTLTLDYPSVGATENLLMAAAATPGTTRIINAALEPEVLDLIEVLKKMGAQITIEPPMNIVITGTMNLKPIEHTIMYDRLEVGSLLLAAAITGGQVHLPQANPAVLDVFLLKLQEMGHRVVTGLPAQPIPQQTDPLAARVLPQQNVSKDASAQPSGIFFKATKTPRAVSFTTMPYPGFPTDLQPMMMAAQCLAEGTSTVHETVYENRFLHVRELQKMGANITIDGNRAKIIGVEKLYGAHVIATDIRASCALVLAGLAAEGKTIMTGVHHFKRGYQAFEQKLAALGAKIALKH